MVRSVDELIKIPGGGTSPVGAWNYVPNIALLTADLNNLEAMTAVESSGRYNLTPAASVPETVAGAGMFFSVAYSDGLTTAAETQWMDFILPALDVADNIQTFMVFGKPAGMTTADVLLALSAQGSAGDHCWAFQVTAAGGLAMTVCEDGVVRNVTQAQPTPTAGAKFHVGYNHATGEVFYKIDSNPAVLAATIAAGSRVPTQLGFTLGFGAEAAVLTNAPVSMTFSSTTAGLTGFQTVGAPTLPDGAADGSRYKVIGNGGPLFGKALLPGDVIEFIDELSDVIITRFDPNVASPEDLTAALETISTSVAEDIGSLKPIKEIVEDSLTPNLGPNEDGGLVMVGPIPGGTPANDFEGLAMGSLHRYDDESGTLTEYTPAYGEAFKAWTSLSIDGVSIKPIIIYVGVDDAAVMVEDDLFQNTTLRRYFDVGYILHPTQEQYLRAKLKSNALAYGDFPGIPGDGGYIIRGTTGTDEMHVLEGNGITRRRLPAAVRDSSKKSGSSSFVRTAISPNGIHLAHYSNSDSFTIQHVNLETGSAGNVSGSVTYPRHLAWSRDSQYLFAAHGGLDRVTRWDANGTIPVDAFVSGDNAPMVNSLGVGVIAGETKLYALHGGGGSGSSGGTIDGSISVIDYSDMSVTTTIADAGWGATARILDVHTPDDINEYIYIAAASGAMFIYNVTTSTLETIADALPGDVKDIAFHPDGTKAAIAVDAAPYCVVRDLPLLAINVAHDEPADLAAIPELVEYSSDGSMLAVGGQLYQTLTGMVNVTPAGVPSGWDIKFIPRRR